MELARKFMNIFRGLDRAYGTYNISNTKQKGIKLVGKAITLREPVTEFLWKGHLDGSEGIGIVPIMDDSHCFFGAIDIDIYEGLDVLKIFEDIKKFELPLIPFRSKSSGVHCFCFLKEKVPALLLREKLSSFSAILGFSGSEIFPKQSEILSDRGDIGQWINMPYFGGTNTTRFAIKPDGTSMNMEEFFQEVQRVQFTEKELRAFTVDDGILEFTDGPPCLQYLAKKGFASGTRNDGLYNVGVYLKKAFPDTWESKLDSYNLKYFDPCLTSTEVQCVAKSLKNKEYNYACSKSPVKTVCNPSLCKTRKYGVGIISGMPLLTGLTKYDTQPPVWFVDVDGGGRMELKTEEIQSQIKFQSKCMETLNSMPPRVNEKMWQTIIQGLLEKVNIIEAPFEASPRGQLLEFVDKFCTGRAQAREQSEILMGKPWEDNGRHFFRVSDLMTFLSKNKFNEFKINQVYAILKESLGEHHTFKIKGKCVNCWSMPAFSKQTESFDIQKFPDENVF